MSGGDDSGGRDRRLLIHEPSAEHPGWMHWQVDTGDRSGFHDQIGALLVRREDDGRARIRWTTRPEHDDLGGHVHGGALLAFLDFALIASLHTLLDLKAPIVTLEASQQFVARAKTGAPVDALVELVRETGSLVFLRGIMEQRGEQDARTVTSFTGIMKKMGGAS